MPTPSDPSRRLRRSGAVLLLALVAALLPAAPASAAGALIVSPSRDAVVGSSVRVDVRAFEAASVAFLVDGVERAVDTEPEPYTSPYGDGRPSEGYRLFSAVLDLSGLSGEHVLGAVARPSAADGREGTDSLTVTVDTLAPTLTVPAVLGGQGAPLVATASEPLLAPVDGAAVLRDSTGRALPLKVYCHTDGTDRSGARSCADSGASRYPGFRLVDGQQPVVGERYVLELGPQVTDLAGNPPARTRYPVRAGTSVSDERGLEQRWASIGNTRATGGRYLQSRDPGSALVVFTGQSRLQVELVRGPGLGVLEIAGGATRRRVDLYAPTTTYGGTLVYDFGCGTRCFLQVATLSVTGSRNPRSSGTAVAVDGVHSLEDDGKRTAAAVIESWTRRSTSGASAGVVRESSTPGASVDLRFRSSRVDVTTVVGPDQGVADVLVDGRRVARWDGYAPTRRLVHRYVDVPDRQHTLRLVATGRRNAASRGALVGVDAIAVR